MELSGEFCECLPVTAGSKSGLLVGQTKHLR